MGAGQSGYVVAVANDQTVSDVDFGAYAPPSQLHGAVWYDPNVDGVQDAGEPLLAGRAVYLDLNENGEFNGSEPYVLSDAVGAYSFDDIPPGSATVSVATGPFAGTLVAPGSGGLSRPVASRFGPDGNLYVLEQGERSVLRYDGSTGVFIDEFVGKGSGGLDNPVNLLFGPTGDLFVLENDFYVDCSVLRFDGATGAYLGKFVTSLSGGLNNAEDFTWGPDGHLYITNDDSDYEGIFRYNGATGAYMGVLARDLDVMTNPDSLAFGPGGDLYVGNGNRVLRVNASNGAILGQFVEAGSGGLSRARDVAFGTDGNLYVNPSPPGPTDGPRRY